MSVLRMLLLSLFLLFAQQGGLLHALSHGAAEHRKQEGQNKTSTVCEKCINYSTIGSALNSTSFNLTLCDAGTTRHTQSDQFVVYSNPPASCARGPPAVLLNT